MTSLHLPLGSLTHELGPVHLTPEDAGWTWTGLKVFDLPAGGSVSFTLDGHEGVLLPLSVQDVTAVVDGETFTIEGRTSVFARVSDFVYCGSPVGTRLRLPFSSYSASTFSNFIPLSRPSSITNSFGTWLL